ncbi:MAG TPA: hypothetical protein VGB37_01340, partial [Candidatus Lokiarchaeia archaeon]
DEYKEIFLYLSTFDDPIENFFKLLNSERDLVCSSSVNLKKTWKNLKKKIFCPRCLLNFKHAYDLTRRCVRCGREISFSDCSWSNFNKKYSREELMEYWINPIIQFYCCSCYREEKKSFKSKPFKLK